jgi:putative salt-induced outer membrane protein YdiY
MFNCNKALLPAALAAVVSGHAFAADDNAQDKLWSGSVEAGYVSLSGNNEETTFSGAVDIVRENQPWKNTFHADAISSSKDGDRTAEKYYLSDQLDYRLSEKSYLFGRLSYDDDRFSGFDYQATATAGYGRLLMKTDTINWDGEVGLGYRVNKVEAGTDGPDDNEAILRLATLFAWDVSDTAKFKQSLSTEVGSENTVSQSETSLKVAINSSLALKVAYKIKYTEEVPAGTKHQDTETSARIVYSF